ncbi:YopX family protein [Bacillus velezensis]|uniref:YopX family protein n=1 Tax=Bacillus velezensis TaxID=492670 RepID=UPI0021767221|nr:YopX family protein [Bacillus velezensis]UWD95624.1 YopX family protein [Bacillus velezensis]
MREIKFRAWDENSQEMIYEVGITPEGIPYSIPENAEGCDQFNYFLTCHKMQYTGLKDKNGRDIYEGDILEKTSELYTNFGKTPTGKFHTSYIKVIWIDDGWGYEVIENNGRGCVIGHKWKGIDVATKYSVVCGNIYEEPELLKSE